MSRTTHRSLFIAFIFAVNACAVAPVLAKDTLCNFRAKGLSLNFGVLNPSIVQDISKPITVATTFADQAGDCVKPGDMTIDVDGSKTRKLTNGANTINYTISGLPIKLPMPGNAAGKSGNGYVTWFTLGQLQGTILWSDYADAPAGNYSDNFTISVNP